MTSVRGRVAAIMVSLVLLAFLAVSPAQALTWSSSNALRAPTAPEPAPMITNSELVVSTLDPSGLPETSILFDQVTAVGIPEPRMLENPTSTNKIAYVGQRGTPDAAAAAVRVEVGGAVPSVTTTSTFGKPLPIALHAEYQRLGEAVAPDSVARSSGELTVTYTETNTTAELEDITYTGSDGVEVTREVPVFAPYVGVLRVSVPTGTTLISAPGAIVETTPNGETTVQWRLVLYPPLGDYTQQQTMTIAADDLRVPALTMEVVPVTAQEDATTAFVSTLLDSSVSGNAQLTSGVNSIDQAVAQLASATSELTGGLTQLQSGSAQLAEGLSSAETGSEELAAGSAELADKSGQLTSGLDSLSGGMGDLSSGLGAVATGLDALAATSGVPTIEAQIQTVAGAVSKIAAAVGSPSDPPLDPDSSVTPTLYQIAVASEAGAAMLDTQVSRAAGALWVLIEQELPAIIAELEALAAAADQAIADLQASIDSLCSVTPEPAECPALRAALDWLIQAREQVRQIAIVIGGYVEQAIGALTDIAAAAVIGEKLVSAMQAMQTGLIAVNSALVSGSSSDPGVYEGLILIGDAVAKVSIALTQLATGATAAASGAQLLTGGAQQLATGSGALSAGSEQLAAGTEALAQGVGAAANGAAGLAAGSSAATAGSASIANGAVTLQTEGTSALYRQLVSASGEPAFAAAYLRATDQRLAAAMPFGPPEGAQGRAAYVSTLTPPVAKSGINWGAVAAAVLVLGALLVIAYRRITNPDLGDAAASAAAMAGAGPPPRRTPGDVGLPDSQRQDEPAAGE